MLDTGGPAHGTSRQFRGGLNLGLPGFLIDGNAVENGGRSLGDLTPIANGNSRKCPERLLGIHGFLILR